MNKLFIAPGIVLLIIVLFGVGVQAQSDASRQLMEPVPERVTTASRQMPPSDAIVLFDGSDLDAWLSADSGQAADWLVQDGVVTVKAGASSIKTRQTFADMQLHIEWKPTQVIKGSGQSRGNSGVFLHSLYEVQILDSWENPTYVNGQAGAVYLQHAPLVNAAKAPGQWQSYDIIFAAPVFGDNGDLKSPAYVTVMHNGVVVQNHVEIKGATFTPSPVYEAHCIPYSQQRRQDCHGKMPLTLQEHGQIVSYRNIWLREL